MKVLKGLSAGGLLTPKQMNAAARALTVLETRPEIHGYKQLASQLASEKQREATGLTNLGTRTEGNVSSVYQNIAKSAAESLARENALGSSLASQSANIAKEGASSLAQMQTGELGNYENQLQMRGAQGTAGGAQDALAQAVAAQQTRQNEISQAEQQGAVSQAQGNAGLLAAMAGATQARGGEEVGAIGRGITNRIGEQNAKYNTNIQTARGKLAEAKAGYGAKFVKNALGLREGEQKFKLGEQAVQGEKAKLAAAEAQNAASNALAAKRANAEATSAHASLLNALVNKWEAEHPNASSSATAKQRQKTQGYVKEIRALIPQAYAAIAANPNPQARAKELNNPETFNAYINEKASAPSYVVRHVLKHYFTKKGRKLGHDVNGKSLGR